MKSVRIRRDALPDHPWIFRKQVQRPDPGTRNGDPVRILARDGNPLGAGLYNGKSQIAIRVLTRDTSAVVDGRFLRRRLEDAVKRRREVLQLERRTDAYRVVNSEPQLLCLTFSPKANLIPCGASVNFISSGNAPHRSLITWFWPPIGLAEPCRMLAAVTPPANCR